MAGLLVGLAAEWVARSSQSLSAAGADLAVGWALIACGLIGWARRPLSGVGPLIALCGFTWFFGTAAGSGVSVIATIGTALLTLHRGPLFHAIIGYPSGRAGRRLAVFAVLVGYTYAAIVPLARNEVTTIVVITLVLVATVRGYAVATGPDRQARVAAMLAAVVVAIPLIGGSVERMRGGGPGAEHAILWGYEAALVLAAGVLCADLLLGRWTRAAVTRLVVELGEDVDSDLLQARLARALGDPSLTIAYWLPEAGAFVGERGNTVVLDDPGAGRAITVIEHEGERIAALVHDVSVLDDPRLVDAVASTAKIAISNVRLRADVRRHIAEVDASRRRLLEAGETQRGRFEQALREGVGRRLDDVRTFLDAAVRTARSVVGPTGAMALEEAERELHEARAEVRASAAGLRPAILSDQGLGPALSLLAGRAPVPVDVIAPSDRLPVVVETAIYFVCSEALTNVAKHAHASRVDIVVRAVGGSVEVRIADDGVGGADPGAGSGLRGATDRIEALGGTLLIESSLGQGTCIRAEIPTAERWAEPRASRGGATQPPVATA